METSFAARVREFRKHKGLSQQAFAERCGLEQTNIAQMEKGTDPKQSNAVKLLAGFPDLSSDWLLLGAGSMLRGAELAPIARTPTPGLTSGTATVAEAENILLRQQNQHLLSENGRLWEMLGKPLSSLEAALRNLFPHAPQPGAALSMAA